MSKIVIGRGGFGEVYYYKDKPGIAYKENHSRCNDLRKEYDMWNRAYRAFITYTSSKKSLRKNMCILRPSSWRKSSTNSEKCIFKMARIVPLEGKYIWQAYIGNDDPDLNKVVKTNDKLRGRYVGPNVLAEYFDVQELAYEAGLLIGVVHYCAKLNGTDTELVIGKISSGKDSKCRLFLIDYDQVRPWNPKDPQSKIVRELSWALSAEPYWPTPESPYHQSFRKGYLEVAKTCGYEDLAKKVLEDF